MNQNVYFAKKMKKLASKLRPNDYAFQDEMWVLGYISCIGLIIDNNIKTGGIILKSMNFKYSEEICALGEGRYLDTVPFNLLALTYLTTYSCEDGYSDIDIEENLDIIAKELGDDSELFMGYVNIAKKLKAAKLI